MVALAAKVVIFFAAFAGMEAFAWATHRYVMHGALWCWHRSHHEPRDGVFELNDLFAQVGKVESVSIITDRMTGRSKGFGFVEMDNDAAENAITKFNGTDLDGRKLTVNEARPLVKKDFGGGGGGGRGGGGGGRRDRY